MKNIQAFCFQAVVLATIFTISHSYAQTTGYAVRERGADYRVWQKTTIEHGTNRLHKYFELATGLNYTNSYGQLVESKEEIDILPQGGAAATQGRHKVYFPGNINTGLIKVVTPDGKPMQSRPLGIFYDDGKNTVALAVLTNSVGLLIGSNEVVYPNAFSGLKADLHYTYRKGGFEQDIVLQQQPRPPEYYGLDPAKTHLQVLTEFGGTADPVQKASKTNRQDGLRDTTLTFGQMKMVQGKAFAIGNSITNSSRPGGAAVYKSWQHIAGRTFLVEELPVRTIAAQLQQLPMTASADTASPTDSILQRVSPARLLPTTRLADADTKPVLIAKADMTYKSGVVLDYDVVDTDQTDFTFESGTTYYISSAVNFDGTITFEGGSVLKFDSDSSVSLTLNTADIVCPASPASPAIFTAKDDDSIGDVISGSTGNPNGYYYGGGLSLAVEDEIVYNISNLVFSYQNTGIILNYSTLALFNVQTHFCNTFLEYSEGIIDFQNCLFDNTEMVLSCADTAASAEYVTVYNCDFFAAPNDGGGSILDVTNSLIVNVPSITYDYYPFTDLTDYETNHTVTLTSGTGVFKTAAAANFYLATSSPYRDIGTTSIDSGLLAEIQTLTTYAPQDGGFPDTNALDLGYHYPTNEDSDFDGLPDWWEWKFFGTFNYTGTNLDSYGKTFLYDYENGYDPNFIQFSIEATNDYFNITNASLQLNILDGVPSYIAVLVDSTNFTTASWTTYTSTNLTVNLGTTEGWHDVWVGLRGLPSDAQEAWQWKRLKLDLTAPQIALTNPVPGVVTVPMIQVQGFSPEKLLNISCDVSNAAGMTTNIFAGVTDQYYDTNTWEFSTNYFECLDVPLTNGVNQLIIHATDLAGNVTTTNFSFTLDYSSKTNPPLVQLTMPLDGMKVCGSSFTLRGQVDDPTAVVTASITDTNGDTNFVYCLVERNGRFWLENVPLNSGTNCVSITVSDAVGNTIVTNINLVQSALTLTMTPVSDDSQLWQPTVSVGGTISDYSDAVWVNGVAGVNNGNGTWNADNVPTTSGGVATFDVTAYPPSEAPSGTSTGTGVNPQTANAANSTTNNADKPPRLYVKHYGQNVDRPYSWRFDTYDEYGSDFEWTEWHNTSVHLDYHWDDGVGGSGSQNAIWNSSGFYDGTYGSGGSNWWSNQSWPASSWPDLINGTQTAGGDYNWEDFDTNCGTPSIIFEHCAINQQFKTKYQFYEDEVDGPEFPHYLEKDWWDGSYARNADVEIRFDTGGMAVSKKKHLFQFSSSATQYIPTNQSPWALSLGYVATNVPMTNITILNKALDIYGNVYLALPDNDVGLVVTPQVKGVDYYTFTEPSPARSCAPVKVRFYDAPTRSHQPAGWFSTLQLVCTGSDDPSDPNYTNYVPTVIASITYGFQLDSGLNVIPQYPSGDTNLIVIDAFNVDPPAARLGIEIRAHYIGCCDHILNWVQTLNTTNPPPYQSLNQTNFNDHCCFPPYYYGPPGSDPINGIDIMTDDYP